MNCTYIVNHVPDPSSSHGSATTSLRQKSLKAWKQHFVLIRNKKLTSSGWYLGEGRLPPKPLLKDFASKNSSLVIQWGLIMLLEVSDDQSGNEQSAIPPKGCAAVSEEPVRTRGDSECSQGVNAVHKGLMRSLGEEKGES